MAGESLVTGFVDTDAFVRVPSTAYAGARAAGGTTVRIVGYWKDVAPASRPANPADPGDPAYNWTQLDQQLTTAISNGFEPILDLAVAPTWAERGSEGYLGGRDPDPAEFGLFARAAAHRYSGTFAGLPRIRYWMAWNEPNLDWFRMPQFAGDDPVSPEWYREIVNQFANAVHGVHSDNLVVAGGLTPFGDGTRAIWPLRFMRELLCMSGGANPLPTCSAAVRFDVWSAHPYANGGPLWQAWDPDGGSIGDMPEVRGLLAAAAAAGHIVTLQPFVRIWVTEFSWDSSPPDPAGAPDDLHVRWVAEGLYRMWRNDVSLVMWFTVFDEPFGTSPYQSGLYRRDTQAYSIERPKPALQAFRFPFVALPENGRAFVWGRTPDSKPAYVAVEALVNGTWTHFSVLRANKYGVFMGRVPIYFPATEFRARHGVTNDTSVPFSLVPPPNNGLVLPTPFGTP